MNVVHNNSRMLGVRICLDATADDDSMTSYISQLVLITCTDWINFNSLNDILMYIITRYRLSDISQLNYYLLL